MDFETLALPEVVRMRPRRFSDERGAFLESFNQRAFFEATGLSPNFVQDNESLSARNVLRGLHYQLENVQGKLVRVVSGEIFDVAVDIRTNSPNYGQWVGAYLSDANLEQLWIPEGFAHGFVALADNTRVIYKTTDFYNKKAERSIIWNDSTIDIDWPLSDPPILAEKDASAPSLLDVEAAGDTL